MPKTIKPNPAQLPPQATAAPKNSVKSATTPPLSPAPKTKAAPADLPILEASKPLQTLGERLPTADEHEVTFKFLSPQAQEVKVAGNFNSWKPEATPLKNSGAGEWSAKLKLPAGEYEYRFVVDGHWCEDPLAAQRGVNPYGGFNSVITVAATARL